MGLDLAGWPCRPRRRTLRGDSCGAGATSSISSCSTSRGGCSSRIPSSRTSPCSTRRPGTAWSRGRPGARGGSRTATAPTYCALPFFAGAVGHLPAERPGPVVRPDGRRQADRAQRAMGRLGPARRLPLRRRGPRLVHPQAGRRPRRHPRLGHGVHGRRTADAGRAAADRAATRGASPITCRSCGAAPTSSSRGAIRKNNLFLAGPAGNLLAPSYAGWKKARRHVRQGLPGRAVDHLHRRPGPARSSWRSWPATPRRAKLYAERRDLARKGLPRLTTDEGYFIKSLDPDGTRHGVYGAAQARLLRGRRQPRRDLLPRGRRRPGRARSTPRSPRSRACGRTTSIITNYPSLDDMYEPAHGLAVGVRHVGQRRALVDLRGPHDHGLLPAGQVRGRPRARCSRS